MFRTVQMMIDRLQANPVLIQLPLGSEEKFKGIIDLIDMQAIILGKMPRAPNLPWPPYPRPRLRKCRNTATGWWPPWRN